MTAENRFISTAREQWFDIRCIRANEESAIGALKPDFERLYNFEVDPTGSGTHVEDVEWMSQKLKRRVRCHHFHDLPFTILKKNTMFCARGVNLVASSTSADKTSPFKHFTGRKLDAAIDLRVAFGDYV